MNKGDGTFWPKEDYQVNHSPYSIGMGNFDGDSDLDLAVASWESKKIAILFNDGDGVFDSRVDYEFSGSPYSISTGDFDNDSDIDLAASISNGGGKLAILMNNGDGTFALPVYYDTEGMGPISLAVGKLNGGNDLDVAVSDYLTDNVSVFLNKGNGTFDSAVLYEVLEEPMDIAFGDFDGDNSLDIAVACSYFYTRKVSILFNDSDGTFSSGGNYSGAGSTRSLAAGDFDKDGDIDIAVIGGIESSPDRLGLISFLFNQGDGTFIRGLSYDIPQGGGLNSVAVGDLDNDSDMDVVATSYYYDVVVILFNLLIP